MGDLILRDARDGERDELLALTLAAYEEFAAAMPAGEWPRYRESIVRTLRDVRPAEQIVAESGGTIVGTALLYPAGSRFTGPDGVGVAFEWPEARLLAVAPTARGRGVGSAIIRECIRRAAAAGADAITLHTTDFMPVAMGMYERTGFERAPELDFRPAPEVLVKGYRLALTGAAR
jgi:GNAT superfamily N-acetyltransferase